MVTAKLYVEGAGPRRFQQSQCRRAFAKFFESAGVRNRPRVEPCGGRKEAFDSFCRAMKTAGADELPLLLVDAEDTVAAGHTTWQHLKARPGDGWDRPAGAGRLLGAVRGKGEATRQLAYRLYTLCERQGWAEDARAYNELITSWSGIEAAVSREQTEPTQGRLFE